MQRIAGLKTVCQGYNLAGYTAHTRPPLDDPVDTCTICNGKCNKCNSRALWFVGCQQIENRIMLHDSCLRAIEDVLGVPVVQKRTAKNSLRGLAMIYHGFTLCGANMGLATTLTPERTWCFVCEKLLEGKRIFPYFSKDGDAVTCGALHVNCFDGFVKGAGRATEANARKCARQAWELEPLKDCRKIIAEILFELLTSADMYEAMYH